jgi:cytochrome c-type biogenesis protein
VSNLAVGAVALFGAGLAAATSPCVAPLVPGYLAALGAPHAGDTGATDPSPHGGRALRWFVAGALGTFAFVGAVAGTLGLGLGASSTQLQRASGALLLAMALLLVLGRTGLGSRLFASRRVGRVMPTSPRLRGLALGIGCGAAWTPCSGPLLGAALTAAAASGSAARATVLLVAYAAGVVAPLVAVAAVGAHALGPRARTIGRWWGHLTVPVMLVLGLALASGRYAQLVGWW